jgi:hypothetical protein
MRPIGQAATLPCADPRGGRHNEPSGCEYHGSTALTDSEDKVIRELCKGVVVLLAFSPLATASRGLALESKDGLYTAPDSEQNAHANQESTSARSAQSYMDSLDHQAQRSQPAAEKATPVSEGKTPQDVAAGNNPPATFSPLSEQAWIALLAGMGILVSLAAAGFVWWSRTERVRADRSVLLTLRPDSPAEQDTHRQEDQSSQRRAA